MLELWEVLVPRSFNDGTEIDISYHRAWDEKVRQIAGGLTILRSTKGTWVSPEGKIFREEITPVRIACSEGQMREIIDLTMTHYDQLAVMAYRISDFVIIAQRDS